MIIILLIVMFAITSFTVGYYKNFQKGFAAEWYARGEQDLRAKHVASALADFRTALTYSHDNPQYELRLAQALLMAGNSAEARAEARTYLLTLLEREPGNGTVNLELARLAARNHDIADAQRYYHAAIYGQWARDVLEKRRGARLELVEFLLASGQKDSARAELIDMATGLPPDPALQTKVGTLLMQVKGYDDALKLFHRALLEDPNLPGALAGAGESHFQKGDYAQAERYLSRAVQQDPQLVEAAVMRDTAHSIINLDPFNRGLGNVERARRAILDFNTAVARLQNCAAQKGVDLNASAGDPLQTLYAQASELQPKVRPRSLSRDSDLLSHVMDVVFDIEQTTARTCGEPQGRDYALLLMAQQQGGNRS